MRVSDDRYTRDRQRLDLALRLIRHEARTFTIRQWTGLSDDRIRKLYRSYVLNQRCARGTAGIAASRRARRHSSSAIAELNFQAAQLASLFVMYGLLCGTRSRTRVALSRRIAGIRRAAVPAYEAYLELHAPAQHFLRARVVPAAGAGAARRGRASRAATCAAACGCAICWRSASSPARNCERRPSRRPPSTSAAPC